MPASDTLKLYVAPKFRACQLQETLKATEVQTAFPSVRATSILGVDPDLSAERETSPPQDVGSVPGGGGTTALSLFCKVLCYSLSRGLRRQVDVRASFLDEHPHRRG